MKTYDELREVALQTAEAHVFGGGTVFHVRPHLALCAPAFGTVAKEIAHQLEAQGFTTECHLTKMADPTSQLETNADIAKKVNELVANPFVKMLFMSAALCDFEGHIIDEDVDEPEGTPSGKDQPRLKTSLQNIHTNENVPVRHTMMLTPADKIISRIRKTRKDIFLVGFKTTAGATPEAQFEAGLELLKKSSCNLVLANDVHTRLNMVLTPEQARYHETTDRQEAIAGLVEMADLRSRLHFTRSTVIEGGRLVEWVNRDVPETLRAVVDHCIAQGAYKPFLGSTVGHFAVSLGNGRFLTSRRKTNFNDLYKVGLVLVEAKDNDTVMAYGARPSVGGQSQRVIFENHPGLDCIFHAHVPLRPNAPDAIPVKSQREFECGSHECGRNTSLGLKEFELSGRTRVRAVHLQNHGPNVVFSRGADPQEVIQFIERNFDLSKQTGDLSKEPAVTPVHF